MTQLGKMYKKKIEYGNRKTKEQTTESDLKMLERNIDIVDIMKATVDKGLQAV